MRKTKQKSGDSFEVTLTPYLVAKDIAMADNKHLDTSGLHQRRIQLEKQNLDLEAYIWEHERTAGSLRAEFERNHATILGIMALIEARG
jgi:hypothetical protein